MSVEIYVAKPAGIIKAYYLYFRKDRDNESLDTGIEFNGSDLGAGIIATEHLLKQLLHRGLIEFEIKDGICGEGHAGSEVTSRVHHDINRRLSRIALSN
jgi:hypothetical protein